jgi:hypothetical protein
MPVVYIETVGAQEGSDVTLRGWVYDIMIRDSICRLRCLESGIRNGRIE